MTGYNERFYASSDGLELYYRDYPAPEGHGAATPVICIPGLTRNARDFDFIAGRIAATRRVLCVDLRGRGRSASDPNWRNYIVPVEGADVIRLMQTLSVPRAVILGTSRGGVIAMWMAAVAPALIAGAILNDMGAQLEAAGLERIYTVLRSPPDFASWEDAAAALKRNNETLFPGVGADRWLAFARAVYRESNGRIIGDYDPAFPAAALELQGTHPRTGTGAADLWSVFDALKPVPALLLRGENSELLTAETVSLMRQAKPDLTAITIKDRGHVPFLDEPESVAAIDGFLQTLP